MIEVKGLTKWYGNVSAIEDVSFSVAKGEIIGFLGPNGAGKSTTMRILTGYSPPTRGTALIAGYDIGKDPIEVKRRVGYLPENVPLYPEMVVRRFLRYVAEIKDVPKDRRGAEVDRVIGQCGLEDMAGRVIQHLSKGYRQRVGLAQALIGSPPVLILDEPTVGLDPRQIIEIRQMIKELAEEHTVLLSTHILPEVAMICKRVLIIHQGKLVARDTMENLAGAAGAQLEVEVDGNGADVKGLLEEGPGVESVTQRGPDLYRVSWTGETDIAPEVARRLVEAGIKLRRLQMSGRTLEDVFIEAISSDSGGQE